MASLFDMIYGGSGEEATARKENNADNLALDDPFEAALQQQQQQTKKRSKKQTTKKKKVDAKDGKGKEEKEEDALDTDQAMARLSAKNAKERLSLFYMGDGLGWQERQRQRQKRQRQQRATSKDDPQLLDEDDSSEKKQFKEEDGLMSAHVEADKDEIDSKTETIKDDGETTATKEDEVAKPATSSVATASVVTATAADSAKIPTEQELYPRNPVAPLVVPPRTLPWKFGLRRAKKIPENFTDEFLATPLEEAAIRGRLKRAVEHNQIMLAVKRRRYNTQVEAQDVGNAMASTFTKLWEQQPERLVKEQKPPITDEELARYTGGKVSAKGEIEQPSERDADDDDDDDNSMTSKERSERSTQNETILGRFMRASQSQEKEEQDIKQAKQRRALERARESLHDTLSYHDRGLMQPSQKDLPIKYKEAAVLAMLPELSLTRALPIKYALYWKELYQEAQREDEAQKNAGENVDDDVADEEEISKQQAQQLYVASYWTITQNVQLARREAIQKNTLSGQVSAARKCPWWHQYNHAQFANARVVHARHVMALAGRYFVGLLSAKDDQVSHRLLRALWAPYGNLCSGASLPQARLLRQTEWTADDFHKFCQYEWTDPRKVCRLLGLTGEIHDSVGDMIVYDHTNERAEMTKKRNRSLDKRFRGDAICTEQDQDDLAATAPQVPLHRPAKRKRQKKPKKKTRKQIKIKGPTFFMAGESEEEREIPYDSSSEQEEPPPPPAPPSPPSTDKYLYSPLVPTVAYTPVPGALPPTPTIRPLHVHGFVLGPPDKWYFARHRVVLNSFSKSGFSSRYGVMEHVAEPILQLTLSHFLAKFLLEDEDFEEDHGSRADYDHDLPGRTNGSGNDESRQLHLIGAKALWNCELRGKWISFTKNIFKGQIRTTEAPQPHFLRSIQLYILLWANGFLPPHVSLSPSPSGGENEQQKGNDSSCDEDDNSGPFFASGFGESESTRGSRSSTSQKSLQRDLTDIELVDQINSWKVHNGLLDFANLHDTLGVMEILKMLPPSLQRESMTDGEQDPLVWVRRLLDALESRELLTEEPTATPTILDQEEEEPVQVVLLEFAFFEATKRFAHSIERDVTQVRHHEWHLASLAGSLLLCSGLSLTADRRARCYPSFRHKHAKTKIKGMPDFTDLDEEFASSAFPLEVRDRLPKFGDVCKATAHALDLVVNLAKRQQGSCRAHVLVARFLEWRQVMALLLGPVDDFGPVRDMHRHHATQWALCEQSVSSRAYLTAVLNPAESTTGRSISASASRSTTKTKEEDDQKSSFKSAIAAGVSLVGPGIRLETLATRVEHEPGLLERWVGLVDEIGPLSFDQPPPADDTSVGPFGVGAVTAEWWGSERMSWWDHTLLSIPPLDMILQEEDDDDDDDEEDIPPTDEQGVNSALIDSIEKHLGEYQVRKGRNTSVAKTESDESKSTFSRSTTTSKSTGEEATDCHSWLDALLEETPSSSSSVPPDSPTVRNRTVDSQLPVNMEEVLKNAAVVVGGDNESRISGISSKSPSTAAQARVFTELLEADGTRLRLLGQDDDDDDDDDDDEGHDLGIYCCKLFIRAHFYGLEDDALAQALEELATTTRKEARLLARSALTLLHCMGVPCLNILRKSAHALCEDDT